MKRRLSIALAAALLAAGPACAADAKPGPHVVQDPHYGDTLFWFFQDRWFESITGLMVSQHFDRVQHHADEAEVLRGGMLLSYGLHKEAGEVFARLIERNAAPPVRDRAWYFLAKVRYQRGLVGPAREALDKVERPLPGELEDERQLLAAQIRMAEGDYAGAKELLSAIKPGPGSASQYARFNLGVTLIKLGDVEGGNALLDEVGKMPAPNEEMKSLRDRANVALGFAALADHRAAAARDSLQRVRLQGPQSNKALLAFGWAAAELKNPKDALVPWDELGQRDLADAAVLESKIALPYAYAELGAIGRAMDGYNEAIDLFEGERKRLDESIAAIRSGALVKGLLESNQNAQMSAFASIRSLPEMPHAGHLAQLLASHEFQESFKNLRDLQFLEHNLEDWQNRLATFDDMLANRRQAFAQRLPEVRKRASETDLPALEKKRDALAAELAKVEADSDANAFVDERQRRLLERMGNVYQGLWQSKDPELAERARRLSGALTWELAHEFPIRLWEAKKALKAADQALAEAKQHDAALAKAQLEEPQRFERFAQRIAELSGRVGGSLRLVAALGRAQRGELQDMAAAELESQKERLDIYAAQARLALAQLQDRAQLAGRGDTDAKR